MTDTVSSNGPKGQHPRHEVPDEMPNILPFNLHCKTDPDGPATLPLPGCPLGDDDDDGGDGDDDFHEVDTETEGNGDGDDDPAPANASAALVIRAPRGPQPVRSGYTIAAVILKTDEDGEENPTAFQFLTKNKLQTEHMAKGLASFKAVNPNKLPLEGATHILVNDETGREVFRRTIMRAA